jgi:hypothetical protein
VWFAALQVQEARRERQSAEIAAERAKDAQCRTIETGLMVIDLTRRTLLESFSTSLSESQQNALRKELEAQKNDFIHLGEENYCPKRIVKQLK